MNNIKHTQQQICSSLSFSNPTLFLLNLALLVCSLPFAYSLGFKFSVALVITISVLFLSTSVFVARRSRKKNVGGKLEMETVVDVQQNEMITPQLCEYEVESVDYPPDSESSDDFDLSVSDENLELNWFGTNIVMDQQTADMSECSVSDDDDDEDSLIEISLPENNFDEYSPETRLKQLDLMEFLEDIDNMNEDESLIEIDISIGSIKS